MLRALRRRLGALVFDNALRAAPRLGRLHPDARPERHGLTVVRDVAYRASGLGGHRLDVWHPRDQAGLLPAVLYLHGGGFRILSKDTHWMMALAFARRGLVLFNANYRLAPKHPFPAAVEDACAAYEWVARNARGFGADPTRLALAGDSAGANLAVTLALAACYRRPEPFARAVFDTQVTPRAVVAACGLYQVSDTARFARRKRLPFWLADRLAEVELDYLDRAEAPHRTGPLLDLADPLRPLERGDRPERALPPVLAFVGTRDPLLDDTRRLQAALAHLGASCEARYYPGELHAFHALVFRKPALRAWRHIYAFLDRHVGVTAVAAPVPGWIQNRA